jgi:hypothetical protein
MPDSRELVVLVTRGTDHELSSVAFTIACGGITSGMEGVRVPCQFRRGPRAP